MFLNGVKLTFLSLHLFFRFKWKSQGPQIRRKACYNNFYQNQPDISRKFYAQIEHVNVTSASFKFSYGPLLKTWENGISAACLFFIQKTLFIDVFFMNRKFVIVLL